MFIAIFALLPKSAKNEFDEHFLRNVRFGSAKPVIFLRENVDSRAPTIFHVFSQKLEKWKTHFLNTAKTSSYATISHVFATRKNIFGKNPENVGNSNAQIMQFLKQNGAHATTFSKFWRFSHFFGLFSHFPAASMF